MPQIATFVLISGKGNCYHAAAALGVADLEGTLVAADDLLTHRKADAAAAGLGGAHVELLLHKGQLAGRDAGAVVPDGVQGCSFIGLHMK